jgi:SAM-dependent methyltransferase
MNFFERIHGGYIQQRRLASLVGHLTALIPKNAAVLDVGCGDGKLAHLLKRERPDITIRGIDVLVRGGDLIDVQEFNGFKIPHETASYDVVMFIDVLHHTQDPRMLLTEANRVARESIIIKDHLLQGLFAGATLRFMDRIGNARFGVSLPHNYLDWQEWVSISEDLGTMVEWKVDLKLYPSILDLFFGRSLHFLAEWDVRTAAHQD